MSLLQILIFGLFSMAVGCLPPARWRVWVLLAGSLLSVYWLQPSIPIRALDFWLPSASIGVTLLIWAITVPKDRLNLRSNQAAFALIAVLVLMISMTRYSGNFCCLTPSRPPQIVTVLIVIALTAGLLYLVYRAGVTSRRMAAIAVLLIIGLFFLLKYSPLSQSASAILRRLSGQDASLASSFDLAWLGFSYLAFRLLHVIRDYQSGKLPAYTAGEFLTYALFYSSLTAGPIDRSQRFIQNDLRSTVTVTTSGRLRGLERILFGIFKKFVLADTLALIALNQQIAMQTHSSFWMWVFLYAYALRLYFDFAGYTDIALGLALLVGIQLPENFNRPYLKTNLTAFWNSWHITLAGWFRAYVFNPLTRALRISPRRFPVWSIILIGQIATMSLIGLWHGISWSFAIWGLWHALGLFIHNRWSDWMHPRMAGVGANRNLNLGLSLGGWFITFQFVCLGWVWFALPDPSAALQVFRVLFGL